MEVNITIILGVILVALLTEAIVNSVKRLFIKDVPACVPVAIAMITSCILCVLAKLDLMSGFGYPLQIKYGIYIGAMFSGLVASLGANAVYDLFDHFNEYKDKMAVERHIEKTKAINIK